MSEKESATYHLWWTSKDEHWILDGGEYNTLKEAEQEIEVWRQELVALWNRKEKTQEISDGKFEITKN